MNDRDFFHERRQAELGAFDRVLDALPKDKFDYRPHDRSPSTREVIWTLSNETRACCDVIEAGRVDWRPGPPSGDATHIVSEFKRNYAALTKQAASLDDKAWQRPVQFLVGGKLMQEPPLGQFLWYLFFDAIHHRGQLTTYIRPMGGKVPSIYGPSGDDPGQ